VKTYRSWFVLLGIALMLFISSNIQVVEAQGCSISTFTMNPVDPYTHGVAVQLYGASNCGTVRFEIDGSPKAEIGSSTQTETWKTNEFNPGNHEVCFVARGDGGWSNAARSCRTVYVEGSQAPPPGSQSGDNVACWVNSFVVTPSSAPVGSTFNLSGQGQCDGNVRAIRFTIDGSAFGEYGGNTHNSSWGSAGYSTGNHNLCFQVTAGDWGSDKAESCVRVSLTSGGQATNDVAVGSNNTNGQSGQTNQSGPNNDQQSNNPAPITTQNNGGQSVTTDTSGTQPQTSSSQGINWYLGGSNRLSGHYVRAGFDDIRIRSGPGTNYDQLGLLVENHYYPVLQIQNGWVQIQGSKGSGWVSLSVVEEFGGSSSSNSGNSSGNSNINISECPVHVQQVFIGGRGQVTPGLANRIRSGAGTSYRELGMAQPGVVFDVLDGPVCSDGLWWWQINYQGTTGWTVEGDNTENWIERVGTGNHNSNEASSTPIPIEGKTWITAADYRILVQDVNMQIRYYEDSLSFFDWGKDLSISTLRNWLIDRMGMPSNQFSVVTAFFQESRADKHRHLLMWQQRLTEMEYYWGSPFYRDGNWVALPPALVDLPVSSNPLWFLFLMDGAPW